MNAVSQMLMMERHQITKPLGRHMKNGYKILWTDEAINNLGSIIKYLEENWTEKELKKFAQSLERRINLIAIRPQIFPISRKKNEIRRSVLDKHNTIYYRVHVKNKLVEILTLWGSRRDPEKLKF